MKGNCELCGRCLNVFEVDKGKDRVKACSKCITSNRLTGWSK